MLENEWKKSGIPNQTELARIISNDTITDKARVRAHRIWNGARLHEEEMKAIYTHTNGRIDANKMYGLNHNCSAKKPKTNGKHK